MDKLKRKVAVVTGGSWGVGRAFVIRLALLGADVAVVDIDLNGAAARGEILSADSVMEEVRQLGGRSIGIESDLTKPGAASDAITKIRDELGRIDILVNNAGCATEVSDRSKVWESLSEETDERFEANLRSAILCCQASIPILRRQGGAIVNVLAGSFDSGSLADQLAAHDRAKVAITRFTQSLAVELGPDSIRANCILPGLLRGVDHREVEAAAGDTEWDALINAIPLRRLGNPEDCAGALEFLVTDISRYVTGEAISVSGGASLTSIL